MLLFWKKSKITLSKGSNSFFDLMNYPAIRDLTQSFEENKDACLSELQVVLDKIEEGEITELMVHPAFMD